MAVEKVRKISPTVVPNITRVGTNGKNIILEFGYEVSEDEFEIFCSICLDENTALKLKDQIMSACQE